MKAKDKRLLKYLSNEMLRIYQEKDIDFAKMPDSELLKWVAFLVGRRLLIN